MIELALAGLGPSDIAREMGVSVAGVSAVLKSPLVQAELSKGREERKEVARAEYASTVTRAKEILDSKAALAAETLGQLAESAENESVRRAASNDILDRVWGGKGSDVRPSVMITVENLQVLLQAVADERGEYGRVGGDPAGPPSEAA